MRCRIAGIAVVLLGICGVLLEPAQAVLAEKAGSPKKVLVVSTSTRNRFAESIEVAEKTLIELATQSGAFSLDFVRQPTGQPSKPKPPIALGADASPADKDKFVEAQKNYEVALAAYPAEEQKFETEMKQALEKLSPESLKNYDAVVFCYTTGDLPLPDGEGFLAWIKAGHAFIGFGSANETMVKSPGYYDMLGGRWSHFKGPQEWIDLELINPSPKHFANQGIPARWSIKEFAYKIPNFVLSDPAHTEELLVIDHSPTDNSPGHFPLAWAHPYGKGRVFYTSVGGNQDLWDPERPNRKNSPETAGLFRAHILGGIEWALGLDKP